MIIVHSTSLAATFNTILNALFYHFPISRKRQAVLPLALARSKPHAHPLLLG